MTTPNHTDYVNTELGDILLGIRGRGTIDLIQRADWNAVNRRWMEAGNTDYVPFTHFKAAMHAMHYQGMTLEEATAPWFEPTPQPLPPRRMPAGPTRIDGRMLADDNGPILGVGATYMAALHHVRTDWPRFERNTGYLAAQGATFIRLLMMVGGVNDFWPFVIQPQESPALLDRALRRCHDVGLRVQPTILADAQHTSEATRERLIRDTVFVCDDHRDAVWLIEPANESNLNGVSDDQLLRSRMSLGESEPAALALIDAARRRRYTDLIRSLTDIPYAASSPAGSDNVEDALVRLYGSGCRSPIATPHWDRARREDDYRHVRQPWEYQFLPHEGQLERLSLRREDVHMPRLHQSNEPIGCGDKQGGLCDPERIAMSALVTFLSGGCGYVYHSEAGVRGLTGDFADQPHAEATWRAIRSTLALVPAGLANGELANHHWRPPNPHHPLEPSLNGQILGDLGPDAYAPGLVRAYGSQVDGVWYIALLGIRHHVTWAPNRDCDVRLYSPLDGHQVFAERVAAGQQVTTRPEAGTRSFVMVLR